MKNKTLFWLLIAFVLVNIGDVISTMFILKAEMNPLFTYFGNAGLAIGFLLKAVIIYVFYDIYKKNEYPNNMMYYIVVSTLIYGTLILLIAVINNVSAIVNPALIEGVENVSSGEMTSSYIKFVGFLYFIPVLLNIFTFWMYNISIGKVNIVGKKK